MEPLIEVKDLSQEFHLTKGLLQSLRLEKGRIVKQDKVVHAVNQVSFQMEKGEVFSLVGNLAAANPPRPGPSYGFWSHRAARCCIRVRISAI